MPIEFEIKVVAVAGSLRMTIPKEIAKALEIRAGDTVIVTVDDHRMLVEKEDLKCCLYVVDELRRYINYSIYAYGRPSCSDCIQRHINKAENKVKEADCTSSLKDERIPSQEESKKIFVSRDKELRFAAHSWHFEK